MHVNRFPLFQRVYKKRRPPFSSPPRSSNTPFLQYTVMKFLSTLVLLAALSVFTEALHHDHVHRSNHRLSRRGNSLNRRCKQRIVREH